ncbi:hypothetical protein WOLCODRAFT_23610 [Wolfiporia cocos MD-104 SS10]|uniref:Pentacotripeptide-repeat region of PRORP domain-containing protein n=1 Tax=Wolfiporia cocos (strain MD-104) TaxID=742152 RepID=A0A2H3JLT1_WOLCO|nr:hypothetical protein WOLCODRAFT_23610 [Wolfiporia cocos MD-104 SS10]
MSLPPDPASDPQLLELLARLLFDLLVRPRSKHERRRSEQAVGLLYHLALDLARLKAREASLEIVRVLINTQNLLSSTAPGAARGSVDFEYIVLSAFLRSALHQGARATAYRLVAKELSFHTAISAELVDLALDVVRALLRDPSNDDLNHACHLITLLIKSRPSCPIPNAVMKAFYAGTQHHNRSELAETVYGFARKAGASGWQTYAPPGGRVVTWLMEHFAHKSRNAHLARELATEAVKLNIPISLQDRGRFIALAAEQGFATQARALWERYAEGQEKEMVVGNTSTMLRLVSLFVSLTRREDSARLENAASQPASSGSRAVDIAAGMGGPRDNVSGDDAPPSLDSDSDRRASALAESRAPGVASEDASRNSMARLPAVEVVRTADAIPGSRTTPEHGTAFPSSDRGGEGPPPPGASGAAGDAQPSQFRAFAERVFEAFRTSREPWAEAQHFELNALARASFMLGYLEAGMQAFRIMLARREVPDLQDVNVALSILAEYNPTAAARVIERMVSAGLQPDKVTFGSVMHQAIIHRDGPLVAHLMRRARELNCAAFSYKTVGALVRATVTMEDDGRVPAREHLENARALIESLLERGQVPSANMGRDCVLAALRADEPLMAFRFWDRLVRDKAEWGDAVQRRTRRAIAGMVRAHCAAGWLDADMGRLVLTTLGARRAHGARQADAGTEGGG